jgi:hypothetical protein
MRVKSLKAIRGAATVKRDLYKAAVDWIAFNDNAGSDDDADTSPVGGGGQ